MGGHGGATTTSSQDGGAGGAGGAPVEWGRRLAVGASHVCYVRDDLSVACWGDNQKQQTGASAAASIVDTPQAVAGVTDVVEAAAGAEHTCARRQAGGVVCWGATPTGAVGVQSDTPIGPHDLPTLTARSIAVGLDFSCAVDTKGGVQCWGSDGDASLGRSIPSGADPTPAPTSPAITDATSVATCPSCTVACALTTGGVRCWGHHAPSPVLLAGTAGDTAEVVVATSTVAPFDQRVFVRTTGGSVRAFAPNGTQFAEQAPVASGISLVAASHFLVMLHPNGDLETSGDWSTEDPWPTSFGPAYPTPPAGVIDLQAGDAEVCVRTADHVACGGFDELGQLGDGKPSFVVRATKIASGVQRMTRGTGCTALRDTQGDFTFFGPCQGVHIAFQQPDFEPGPATLQGLFPATTRDVLPGYGLVDVGFDWTDSRAYFFEDTPDGGAIAMMASGVETSPRPLPRADYSKVVMSAWWDAGLRPDGSLEVAYIGPFAGGDAPKVFGKVAPKPGTSAVYAGPFAGFAAAAWAEQMCAWAANGAASCWGANDSGESIQLGPGGVVDPPASGLGPSPFDLQGQLVASMGVGSGYSCLLTTKGKVYCWGTSGARQCGDDAQIPVLRQVGAKLPAASHLAVGPATACADFGGTPYCWGENGSGQCGSGDLRTPNLPAPVVQAIAASTSSFCALVGQDPANGDVYCWGDSYAGQVGDGSEPQPSTYVVPKGL